MLRVMSSFSGPVPPPAVLREYNEILPGAEFADRIVRMAEKEQDHRHRQEDRVVSIFSRGQVFALILGLAAIAFASYMAHLGHDGKALSAMLATILILAGTLAFNKHLKDEAAPKKKA